MKVTAQEEFGLRCLLQLARRRASSGSSDAPMTLADIAQAEGLTVPYAAKLVRMLRKAGLVTSVLGRSGGYALARPPREITVAEVLGALGSRFYDPNHCSRYKGESSLCAHTGDCSIRSLWGVLGNLIDGVLSRTTLAELAGTEQTLITILDGKSLRGPAGGSALGIR